MSPSDKALIDKALTSLGTQASPEDVAQVRERLGADWQRLQGVIDKLATIERSRDSGARRYFRIVAAADEFSEIMAPHLACRGRGCSHCCKMAVNITEREALEIGEYLDRAPARVALEDDPQKLMEKLDAEVERYSGQPCPMLAPDGACTIYPVRPLACRLQHSLEDDPEPCRIENGAQWVKKMNTTPFSFALVKLDLTRALGDIREFFP